jgi:hypothetical protein
MIISDVREMVAGAKPIERCPICNSGVSNIVSDWTDYTCGARVIASPHGSWSLSIPCPVYAPV